MPGGISRIEGMGQCLAALRELEKAAQNKIGKRALKAGGQVWIRRQHATLPVSDRPSNPTPGSLRAAPTVASARAQKGSPRVALLIDDIAAVPGEFGTSKMAPHLRVRATTDAVRDEIGATIAEALKQEVDAEVQRIAKG